jgi:hypothetical protein
VLIKGLILYSLPYIVGVASSIVAARQLVPSLETLAHGLSEATVKGDVFLGQVVNRSLKGDRLSIQHAKPLTNANGKIYIKIPARIAPSPEINIRCKRPIDVIDRCFADTGMVTRAT